jgi:hypothetical protein
MGLFTGEFFRSFAIGFGLTAAVWATQVVPALGLA